MGEADAREAAFGILRRVERQGAYASLLLQAMGGETLPARDRALVTELVYGVLRHRLYLDHVIAAFSSRPLERIDADLRLILRLALYQILYLDRIPARAAVNEAVALARRRLGARGRAAAGFANALLRAVGSQPARVPQVPPVLGAADPARALALGASHPEWMVRRWIERFGLDGAERLLAAQNRPAPVALRVNLRRATSERVAAALSAQGVPTAPGRFLERFLVVARGAPQRTDAFRRGEFYIQDEASGLVARMARARPGERILDACAAPGGKALALAETTGERGLVVAGDPHAARLGLLRDNARRLGLSWCVAVAGDFAGQRLPLAPGAAFDIVVVDAPCSGTGVIRRHPELRYRLSPAGLDRLVELQARLLERCAPLVRVGGSLLYSVCSLEPEEGPLQARRFLEEHRGFVAEDPRPDLPKAARALVAAGELPCLITLPHRDDLDGFFAARFRRQR
ncbi:MAG: 16S rRNA (cytosine(967)-C(5))-methyltransferase RsmB [Planctomycetota bacterium]